MATHQSTLMPTRRRTCGICAWILLLLLMGSVTSCSTLGCGYLPDHCSHHWRYEEADACHPCLDSRRAFLLPQVPCGTLRMDIIRDPCGCRLYLNTHCYVFCEARCPSGLETVCVKCESLGCSRTFEAWVFQGGQRLLLGDDAFDIITTALWEGDCPTLSIGMHKLTVTTSDFQEVYRKLVR